MNEPYISICKISKCGFDPVLPVSATPPSRESFAVAFTSRPSHTICYQSDLTLTPHLLKSNDMLFCIDGACAYLVHSNSCRETEKIIHGGNFK